VHEITQTLTDAPRQSGFHPAVVLKAGPGRPGWKEIYTGSEPEYLHAMTVTSSGRLVRARITPPEEGCKLYVQAVEDPGTGSDFSCWNYVNCYDLVVLAVTSLAEEVHLFYILANRRIERLISYDGGLSWNGPDLVDYTPTTDINGIAAAFSCSGDISLFFADQATLYVKKCTGGGWQARAGWPHNASALSGASVVYDGDWTLAVTGRDPGGGYRLWQVVYGDGFRYPVGQWSVLTELAGAPDGENFLFEHASLSFTGVYHCLYNEQYNGAGAYCHTRIAVMVTDNLLVRTRFFCRGWVVRGCPGCRRKLSVGGFELPALPRPAG